MWIGQFLLSRMHPQLDSMDSFTGSSSLDLRPILVYDRKLVNAPELTWRGFP